MLNIVFWIAVFFEMISLIFAIMKGRAAVLISGFNSFSKDERKRYDMDRMSKDMSNLFFIAGAILILGMLFSLSINKALLIVSLILSILVIVFNSNINSKKAFAKYKTIED